METLPQYWKIPVNSDTLDSINKFRATQPCYNNPIYLGEYDYYGISGGEICGLGSNWVERNTTLTLEQFKKFLLKETPQSLQLPEYWCVLCTPENYESISAFYDKTINSDAYSNNFYTYVGRYFYSHNLSSGNSIFSDEPGANFTTVDYLVDYLPKYKLISFEDFTNYFLTQKDQTNTMQKLTIPVADVLKIHSMACNNWKNKITNYLKRLDSSQNISFTQSEVDEMFNAATKEQTLVLEQIFGKKPNTIQWDKIKTGSKVMIKDTGQRCGDPIVDYDKPVDVVFYNTPHGIRISKTFFNKNAHSTYCTFHQNGNYILYSADSSLNYITEVIEY